MHKDGRAYNVNKSTGAWDFGKGKDPWANKTAADGNDRTSLIKHISKQ